MKKTIADSIFKEKKESEGCILFCFVFFVLMIFLLFLSWVVLIFSLQWKRWNQKDGSERIFSFNGLWWMGVTTLRQKCPYSELFWSVFSRMWTEYGDILRISPYSVQMQENMDQNNSKYWPAVLVFNKVWSLKQDWQFR